MANGKAQMKLLIFAHVPPPYHGQSYAVKAMLENFGGDRRRWRNGAPPDRFGIECYHVNARFSRNLEEIGELHSIKLVRLFLYCLEAIWCHFRYRVENFYYVPAPGKRVALYRDWMVMLLCRPFFKRVIFHWHAAGLARWLETTVSMPTRSFTYRRMRDADLSIVLSEFNRRDAEKLTPRRIAIVAGGIPDPCPQFTDTILPGRKARIAARRTILAGKAAPSGGDESTVRVLFLAHCTREKGVFDAIEGVALANQMMAAEKSPMRFQLTLVGAFASGGEEKEVRSLIPRRGLDESVKILGFVSPEQKSQLLADADLFCFPTYYLAENQPGNLIEAMAFGLPVITTRWRSVPEMLPPDYPGIVDPKSPEQIAGTLQRLATMDLAEPLRELFLRRFTLEQNLANMAGAIRSIEAP
jgi:glycosyltransferase involved in cell wall biosynthesis